MRIAIYLLVFTLIFSCSSADNNESNQEKNKETNSTLNSVDTVNRTEKEIIIPIDTVQTEIAYYLAGLKPPFPTRNPIFNAGNWNVYAQKLTKKWLEMKRKRQNDLEAWGASELSCMIDDSLALFYPFSGPDFLHANSFYPAAKEYIMMALEPVNEIPNLAEMDDKGRDKYIDLLNKGLRDVIGKSYFITTHMMEDLDEEKNTGVLPVFYIFLARSGNDIVSVNPIEVDETGQIYKHDSLSYEKNQAVEIKYKSRADNSLKRIVYFSRSISDADLKNEHPNFKKYLNTGLPNKMNGFVKAASYLMHYQGFSEIRNSLLSHSEVIFQDDTGIPLKYIDQEKWDIQLFGAYTRPIKNFSDKMYQPDLLELYNSSPKEEIKEIPFSLGYHVVGDKIQNHQLIYRK